MGGEKINHQKKVPWREERAKQGVRMTVLDDNEFILYVPFLDAWKDRCK